METEGLEFLQFSFRWVNCLLLREIPFELGLRLWDTYLAEGPGMKEFLIYALAAFLLTWDKELRQLDFQVLEKECKRKGMSLSDAGFGQATSHMSCVATCR